METRFKKHKKDVDARNEQRANPEARRLPIAAEHCIDNGSNRSATFLTPDETADLLRTTRKAIYAMIERQKLPGVVRIGRRVLIRSASLLDWLRQKSAASPEMVGR